MNEWSRVRLCSFAEGPFCPRGPFFEQEARSMKVADWVKVFRLADLDPSFVAAHEAFISRNKRGFGYWIWKPQVVLETMRLSESNDLIVYMDVGFELNPAGRGRFLEYFKMAACGPHRQLAFSNTQTEYRWTKQDLAARLDLANDSLPMLSTQLAAGFFILLNTDANQSLVQRWADLAVEDNYRFSDDSPSIKKNHPEFVEHRHDASIFSLLRKKAGAHVTHYEVQAYDHHFSKLKDVLPAWASRKRS